MLTNNHINDDNHPGCIGRPSTPRAKCYRKDSGVTNDKLASTTTVPETSAGHESSDKLNIFQSIKSIIEEKLENEENESKIQQNNVGHDESSRSISSVSDEDLDEIKSQNIEMLMQLYDRKREPGIKPAMDNRLDVPRKKKNKGLDKASVNATANESSSASCSPRPWSQSSEERESRILINPSKSDLEELEKYGDHHHDHQHKPVEIEPEEGEILKEYIDKKFDEKCSNPHSRNVDDEFKSRPSDEYLADEKRPPKRLKRCRERANLVHPKKPRLSSKLVPTNYKKKMLHVHLPVWDTSKKLPVWDTKEKRFIKHSEKSGVPVKVNHKRKDRILDVSDRPNVQILVSQLDKPSECVNLKIKTVMNRDIEKDLDDAHNEDCLQFDPDQRESIFDPNGRFPENPALDTMYEMGFYDLENSYSESSE